MIHLLCRSFDGQPEDVLGAVLNAGELATLQTDGDAMPVGGYLVPIAEYVEGVDAVACNREGKFVLARPFSLVAHEAKQAAKDAAVLSLAPEMRAELFPAFVPEADRKAARAAEREAAKAREAAAKGKP